MKRTFPKGCPADESFVHHFTGGLGRKERTELLEHVARCPKCRLRLNALASLQAQLEARKGDLPEEGLSVGDAAKFREIAREQARTSASARVPYLPKAVRWTGLATAGILLVILGYGLLLKRPSPQPVIRGRMQVQLQLYRPEGKLKAAPRLFAWSKVGDADAYNLEIIDSRLGLVFSTGLTSTRFRLPEDIRKMLERERPYLWTVSVLDDDAQEIEAASGYFEIE